MSVVGRFRIFVGAATAKPSPKVGQALGPLGINMMTFCKQVNERTSKVRPEVPVQVTLIPRTDRTYKFWLRTPQSPWFLMRCSRTARASSGGCTQIVGNVTIKEIYHIALAKRMDPVFIGVPVHAICQSIMRTAKSMGITVTRELLPEFSKRDDVPVEGLEQLRKEIRLKNKASKKGGARK